MLTPLFPSVAGSFSTACSRRKSTASRRLASRNSRRGMIIVVSLLLILRRAAQISLRTDGHWLAGLPVSADWLFPSFLHLP